MNAPPVDIPPSIMPASIAAPPAHPSSVGPLLVEMTEVGMGELMPDDEGEFGRRCAHPQDAGMDDDSVVGRDGIGLNLS